jgi:hypothetical protein
MSVQLGKRYGYQVPELDEKEEPKLDPSGNPIMRSVVEVLTIKPGACNLTFLGHELTPILPKVLPSAD